MGGDFASLPFDFAYDGTNTSLLLDWSGLFNFAVAPDVVGDPDGSAALVITNTLYTQTYAFTDVPEPSVVVTGLIFGLVTVGGVLRGRARRRS